MLDDNRDKELQQKQVLAIVVITLLFVAWSFFFLPKASPPQEPASTAGEAAASTALPSEEASAEPLAETTSPAEHPEPVPDASPDLSTLPMVAEDTGDPDADLVVLENESLRLEFTRVGARLKRATAFFGTEENAQRQLIPWDDQPDADAVYPLGLRFSADYLGDALDSRRWDVETDEAAGRAVFSITLPGEAKITKTVQLDEVDYVADISVSYVNLSDTNRRLGDDTGEPAFSLNWGPNVDSGDKDKFTKQEVYWRQKGESVRRATGKLKMPLAGSAYSESEKDAEWGAITSCYFVVAMKPDFDDALGWVLGVHDHFRVGLGAPRVELAPGEACESAFRMYMGPRLGSSLKAAWPGLDKVLETFTVYGFTPLASFMNWFAITMLKVMNAFYTVIPNYGLAIIFLTILVRLGTFPLTLKSMKSMKRMQKLAPEIEKLKEEVGEDQQEVQRRMMELYRERGVSPLGGCLPLFIQMPVFFAFYRMLANAFELRGAPFVLWITDLSAPDRLIQFPTEINLVFLKLGAFNLLPILMGFAMVLSTKLTPSTGPAQNSQQKFMMTFMPIFFAAICYNMPSALNLYILTSTLLGIVQNYFVHVDEEALAVAKKKKGSPRARHFYAAAHARKREAAREARRDKRLADTKRRGQDGVSKKR